MSYEEVKRLLQMINIDLSEQYARCLFKVRVGLLHLEQHPPPPHTPRFSTPDSISAPPTPSFSENRACNVKNTQLDVICMEIFL